MSTILVTGSSSGFGLEAACFLLDRDWTVIATMRAPREDVLPASERLRVAALDVTDAASIAGALDEAGPIDALVNNAGAGLMGALQGVSIDATRQLFELNTFGTMAMTQAVLPGFRAQGSGVIVNVSSAVTLKALPMLSAYTASKAAVEAFSEALALEVEPFGVRVRLVIPAVHRKRRSARRPEPVRRTAFRKPMPHGPSRFSPPSHSNPPKSRRRPMWRKRFGRP